MLPINVPEKARASLKYLLFVTANIKTNAKAKYAISIARIDVILLFILSVFNSANPIPPQTLQTRPDEFFAAVVFFMQTWQLSPLLPVEQVPEPWQWAHGYKLCSFSFMI